MIFIGGIQPRTVKVEKAPMTCPHCAHPEVYWKRVDHYLSLFFIPLFPIKRGGVPFLVCDHCGALPDGYSASSTFEGETSDETRYCGYCNRMVAGDFSYCPYCGKAL